MLRHFRAGCEIAGAVLGGHTTGSVLVASTATDASLLAFVNGCRYGWPSSGSGIRTSLPRMARLSFEGLPHPLSWRREVGGNASNDGPANFDRRPRLVFELDRHEFEGRHVRLPPPGCEIVALDAAGMRKVAETDYRWMANTWRSPEAFERDGTGFCAIVGGEIACVCYSVFVSGKHHEVDILTVERFRNCGLARATASAFVERAIACDRQPGWNCYEDNAASCRLAESLGFKAVKRFHVFSR